MLVGNDSFFVKIKDELTNSNIRTITLLYKPIIGNDGYVLYMYLYSLCSTELTYNLSSICTDLKISLNELDECFAKLEATSLIDKYYNGKNGYFVELKKPEDPKNLLLEGKYSTHLIDRLSEDEYKRLLQIFNVDDLDLTNYKKTSRTYYQVFGSPKKIKKVEMKREEVQVISDVKTYDTSTFSYTSFEQKLQGFRALRNTEKQLIISVANDHSLTEDEMVGLLHKSIDDAFNIDNVKLNELARKMGSKRKKAEPVVEQQIVVPSGLSDEERLIYELENTSHAAIFKKLGAIPSTSDIANLEKLKKESQLSNGVINVLLLYVLNIQEGLMPAYNYLEKIASHMQMNDVRSTTDALTFINKQYVKHEIRNEGTTQRSKPVRAVAKQEQVKDANAPEWLEQEMKRAFG